MEVRIFVDILRRWWAVLLVVAALAGLAGYAVADRLPPQYSSTSRVIVGAVVATAESIRAARDNIETYAALVTSQPVLERIGSAPGVEMAPEEVAAGLTVRTDVATRIISVTGSNPDAHAAANLANAAAEQLRVLSLGGDPASSIDIVESGEASPIPDGPGPIRSAAVAMSGGILGTLLGIVALEFLSGRVRGRFDLEGIVASPFLGRLALGRQRSRRGRDAVAAAAIISRAIEVQSLRPRSVVIPANDRDRWDPAFDVALALAFDARERHSVALILPSQALADAVASASPHSAGSHPGTASARRGLSVYADPDLSQVTDVSTAVGRLGQVMAAGIELAIICAPPLHLSSPGVIWARAAESAIVVARAGKTRRHRLEYTCETLAQLDTPVLGSILVDGPIGDRQRSYAELQAAQARGRNSHRRRAPSRRSPEDLATP